jgi:hypothetical protein
MEKTELNFCILRTTHCDMLTKNMSEKKHGSDSKCLIVLTCLFRFFRISNF